LVAVLPFTTAGGVDESLGPTLAGAMLGEVRKQRGAQVRVMAPDDVVEAMPGPLRGRLKRCAAAACRAQMAQAVGADQALTGAVSRVGGTVVLNLALVSASDGAQVAQWTGNAPASAVDKLLSQLPDAVRSLLPAPDPPAPAAAPVAAPVPPPARPAVAASQPAGLPPPLAAPTTTAGAGVAPPGTPVGSAMPPPLPVPEALAPLPAVTPILPVDEPSASPVGLPPAGPTVLTAQDGMAKPVPATGQTPTVSSSRGWSFPLLAVAAGVAVPGILLGLVAAVASVGTLVGGIAAHRTAYMINQELKSVPHKRTENPWDYDIETLVTTGRALEAGAFISYGAVGLLVVVSLVALAVGSAGGAGLVLAAAPKGEDEDRRKKTGRP
jgi:TolB-like protein